MSAFYINPNFIVYAVQKWAAKIIIQFISECYLGTEHFLLSARTCLVCCKDYPAKHLQ